MSGTDRNPGPAEDGDELPEALQGLVKEFGIDSGRVERICCVLAAGAYSSVEDVVSLTGTSRRTVEDVITAVGADAQRSGDKVRISPECAPLYRRECCREEYENQPGREPWGRVPDPGGPALGAMTSLIAHAPPPLQRLDHVPATAETVLGRARFMHRRYNLRGARILFVGDHDVTSLALFLAGAPEGMTASVVDVDERTLDYIDGEARRRGWPIQCYFADLRIGLPSALADSVDLVFTDPPYTPEGVLLFAARGVAALGDHHNGRLLVAYGFGERQPALGLAVQEKLALLHLVYEGVLPDFNRYLGAQSIGGTAALYLLRPTRRTKAAAQALSNKFGATVYTHGSQSVEAEQNTLGEAAVLKALAETGTGTGTGDGDTVLVGAGYPAGVGGRRHPLSALVAGSLPAFDGKNPAMLIINLYPSFGSSLVHAILAADAGRLGVLCRNDLADLRDARGQHELARLVAPKYRVAKMMRSFPSPDSALLLVERADPSRAGDAEQVANHIYRRPHGKIGNTWREGLVAMRRGHGETLTKAEARALVEGSSRRPDILRRSLLDLPRSRISTLLDDIGRSVGGAGGG